jgi:hypothetical protein
MNEDDSRDYGFGTAAQALAYALTLPNCGDDGSFVFRRLDERAAKSLGLGDGHAGFNAHDVLRNIEAH